MPESIRISMVIALGMILSGCVITEKVYVTEVEAAGPVALPPVIPTMELREAGAIAVVPHFAVNTEQKIRGRINPVGTTPRWGGDDNLLWKFPRSEGGLDVQVSVAPSVAILAGGMVGAVEGSTFGDFRGGLAVFTVSENKALRLDAGIQFLSIRSRIRTTVETRVNSIFGNALYRSNFDDTRDQSSISPYAALTFNTASQTSPLNFLVNVGVSGQPLFNYSPAQPDTILGPGDLTGSAERIRETVTIYSVTPAMSVQLGGGSQLLLGARMVGNFNLDRTTPEIIWQPFIQAVMQF